jgi:hypothetical protein
MTLNEKAIQLDSGGETATFKWRVSSLSGTEQYLEIHRFPITTQKLFLGKIHSMQKRISAGQMPPISDQCDCSIFR